MIRVYDGRPFALADHLDRLERSAGSLRLADVPRAELEAEIAALLEARGGPGFDGNLRLVLTRGAGACCSRSRSTRPSPRSGSAP